MEKELKDLGTVLLHVIVDFRKMSDKKKLEHLQDAYTRILKLQAGLGPKELTN